MLGEVEVRAVCVGLHHGRPVMSVSGEGSADHCDVRGELAVGLQQSITYLPLTERFRKSL
jgi:hypothetical protein